MVACDALESNQSCLDRKFGDRSLNALNLAIEAGDPGMVNPKRELINIRLLKKNALVRAEIKPREYQSELFEIALKENVVIYLGTGLGKTYIAILILNSPMIDAQIQEGRKVVFLATTQDLVQQQAEYIHNKVPYKVRVYCGRTCQTGKHVDKWNEEEWRLQLSEIDVLCMTPQIFTSAIVANYIKWSDFSVIIFDEVHHAYKMRKGDSGHPYSKALEHYKFFFSEPNNNLKPRLIGLTASIVNHMPKDLSKVSSAILQMECKIDGRCVTSTGPVDSKPLIVVRSYNGSQFNKANDVIVKLFTKYSDEMKEVLGITDKKFISILRFGLEPTSDAERRFVDYHARLELASSGISVKPGSFHKILRQLAVIRQSSGLWTTANIIHKLVIAIDKHSKSRCISHQVRPLYENFCSILKETLNSVNAFLGEDWREILLEFSQPKLLSLLEVLKKENQRIEAGDSEKSTFSCIIFVQSRVEVLAIYNWLSKVSEHLDDYDFLKVGYAIGMAATAASKWACITKRKSIDQRATLDSFRRNDLNVMVTTSVLEEGIDLPVCSTVIRFDPASTFRVYVQSRGRARQIKSSFITLADWESREKITTDLQNFNLFEAHVDNLLKGRDIVSDERVIPRTTYRPPRDGSLYEEESFKAPGILIDSSTGAVYLNIYCSRCSRNYPFSSGLRYRRFQPTEETFQTALTLPFGCPISEEIFGNEKATLKLANESAVIETLKALFEIKELDEQARPFKSLDKRVEELLDEYNLLPDLSPLSREAEGVLIEKASPTESDTYSYPWKLFQMNEPISRAFTLNAYKLFRVVLEPVEVRRDTEELFKGPRLGIIVNSTRDTHLWPKKIYSHYGEFNVSYELLDDNLRLDQFSVHNEYFNFTLRSIQSCWPIGRIQRHEFKTRCLFYLVPLDHGCRIDSRRLVDAMQLRPNTQLRPFDVVKLARFYCRPGDQQKLFLVKRIRTDLNAMSEIPGTRRRQTFYDYALENYNAQIRDIHQPIIEVQAISRELTKYSKGKRVKTDHSTSTIYFLPQFLDLLEEDSALVFQSLLMPPIVYRIYLSALCAQLDEKFIQATSDKRRNVIHARLPEVNTAEDALESEGEDKEGEEDQLGGENEHLEVDKIGQQEANESDEDASSGSSCYDSDDIDSSYCGDSSDEPEEEDELLVQQDSDDWRRFNEQLARNERLPISQEHSYHSQKYLDTNPKFYSTLGQLTDRTDSIQKQLLNGLSTFQSKLIGDTSFVGDEDVLFRDGPTVDLSIVPRIHFDKINPIRAGQAREVGIAEALTQRRATEEFNLEALENVGDSYLKYCISVVLFKTLQEKHEGGLTWARMRLVGNKHFTHLARRNLLGTYAIANKFSEKSLASALGAPECFKNSLKEKALADTVESLIGAYLIYCGEFEAILAIHWLGLKLISDHMFAELHDKSVVFARAPSALFADHNAEILELFEQNKKRVSRFQKILNYNFIDASYLIQAFTHSSAPKACTKSYERLEFLGDAILDHLITQTLYESGITKDPGQLSQSRSALVNNCAFAKLAIKFRYDIFIQHANQDLMDTMNSVNDRAHDDEEMAFLSGFDCDKITKLLADIFESVAGAIYLDSGCSLDTVWSIYYPMMKDLIDAELENPTKNIIMQLFEKYGTRLSIECERGGRDGSSDDFVIAHCIIKEGNKQYKFSGYGLEKRKAKMRAAEVAMKDGPNLPPLQRENRQRQSQNRPRRNFNNQQMGHSQRRASTSSYNKRKHYQR